MSPVQTLEPVLCSSCAALRPAKDGKRRIAGHGLTTHSAAEFKDVFVGELHFRSPNDYEEKILKQVVIPDENKSGSAFS